jgi:hypothetical protein
VTAGAPSIWHGLARSVQSGRGGGATKWTVTVLTLLGGVLPTLGLYGVWRAFGARRGQLQVKLARVEQIMSDPAIPNADKSSRLEREVPGPT